MSAATGADLRSLLLAAAAGVHPTADGSLDVVAGPGGPAVAAIVGFTGRHVVAADVVEHEVRERLAVGDLAAPLGCAFVGWLAARTETVPDTVDVVLAASPVRALTLLRPLVASDHPRVVRAARTRDDVRAFGDETGLVAIGRGLAGRVEVSIEVRPGERDHGAGRRLAQAARSLGPADEPVFAQIAAGNAASIRAFLAAGFRPIGAEVLLFRELA